MKKQKIKNKDLKDLSFDELMEGLEFDPERMAFSLYNKFVETIYDELVKKKLKQKDLANKIGKTQSYVSQILKREIDPSLSTMIEFLLAVDLILDDILIISKEANRTINEESDYLTTQEDKSWKGAKVYKFKTRRETEHEKGSINSTSEFYSTMDLEKANY